MIQQYSRRQFIEKYGQIGIGLLIPLWISCRNKGQSSTESPEQIELPANFCKDYSALSADELKARQSFGYVEASPQADNRCNNCKLWLPVKGVDACGNCMLFQGPVAAEGYCTYWAPQEI